MGMAACWADPVGLSLRDIVLVVGFAAMSTKEFRIENMHDGQWVAGKQPLFTSYEEAVDFMNQIKGGSVSSGRVFRIAMRARSATGSRPRSQ